MATKKKPSKATKKPAKPAKPESVVNSAPESIEQPPHAQTSRFRRAESVATMVRIDAHISREVATMLRLYCAGKFCSKAGVIEKALIAYLDANP